MDERDASKSMVDKPSRAILAPWVALPILIVLVVYVWYISAGKWTSWPKTSVYDYYSSLSSAFRQGHLYLDEKPAPELLALKEPYRIGNRHDIPYIWDASLFRGRYYLYWGPVPALVLLPFQILIGSRPIPDLYLVFGFVCGLFLILSALVVRIWQREFPGLPPWTLSAAVLVCGLAPPLTWMLNRPEVYEAAIAAGQFFLLAGLYVCFVSLGARKPSIWGLALASLLWGLAIGSRNSQALPVLFLLLYLLAFLVSSHRQSHTVLGVAPAAAALLLPIGFVVIALLWYNWARFGSAFEFGYRFQLTLLEMPKHYSEIFSTSYVGPNALNYLFNGVSLTGTFPFINPQYGMQFEGAREVPAIYFSEAVTGLLYAFPFMFVSLAAGLALRKAPAIDAPNTEAVSANPELRWLRVCLLGIVLIEVLTLLVFFFAAERYLADAVPSLALLSTLGMWQGYRRLSGNSRARIIFCAVALLLAAMSITITGLLAISGAQDRFLRMNPELLQHINRLFVH